MIPRPGDIIRPTRIVKQIPVQYWDEIKPNEIKIPRSGEIIRQGDRTFAVYDLSQFDPHKIV